MGYTVLLASRLQGRVQPCSTKGQIPGLSTSLSPEVALFQAVRDQLPFLAPLWTVLIFEVPQGEEELGEDTSRFAFICGKLAALLMMAVPVPGAAKRARKQVEAGPDLLLIVHTPASEPEGTFKAPGDAEPGITATGMGFSTRGLILA